MSRRSSTSRRSEGLSDAERRRVLERLGPVVRAVAQDERSQLRNRELATERIVEQLDARRPGRAGSAGRPTQPTEARASGASSGSGVSRS